VGSGKKLAQLLLKPNRGIQKKLGGEIIPQGEESCGEKKQSKIRTEKRKGKARNSKTGFGRNKKDAKGFARYTSDTRIRKQPKPEAPKQKGATKRQRNNHEQGTPAFHASDERKEGENTRK